MRQHPDLPPAVTTSARQARDLATRREVLAIASSFGASSFGVRAAALLGLAGAAGPARAQAVPKQGGTVRIQQEVRALKDPRLFDWPQIANFTRGWLENLVSYENDGTFRPQLLRDWRISPDARRYTLFVRQGVTWNTGDPFTAQDVARNIARWCAASVPGNSMAGRMQALIDPQTQQAAQGAITVLDPLTVELNLRRPDITLIAGMADYPAAIVHADHDPDTMLSAPLGTGPYLPETLEVGARGVLVRNRDHQWWNAGHGAWMDRIEFLDFGTDPASWVAAAQSDAVDMLYSVEGDFIDVMAGLPGWTQHGIDSASTVVIRPNQQVPPYDNPQLRRAMQLAVDNAVILELGYGDRGSLAENHHVAPLHPAYAPLPPQPHDPAAARALLDRAGLADVEHELISIDDGFRKDTADAVAAQLRDAGFRVRRKVLPGTQFWQGWTGYPFSATDWNHRPLGVQVWALAYRSGAAWNEFGWADPAFDAVLDQALGTIDTRARRALMARGETMIQEAGVTLQPYWRRLYNHAKSDLLGAAHHISFEIRPAELAWT